MIDTEKEVIYSLGKFLPFSFYKCIISIQSSYFQKLESWFLAKAINAISIIVQILTTLKFSNIINHDIYSKFFVENQLVINEKDIMISENGESKIYRPDRLINTGEGYIIIDFKTGDEQEKHLLQIDEYKSVLEKLGKKVLETQLVYV